MRPWRVHARFPLLGAWALLAACSSPERLNNPSGAGSTGGTGGGGGDITVILTGGGGSAGHDASAGPAPTFDANCGNSASTMSQLPADLLLVLDRRAR